MCGLLPVSEGLDSLRDGGYGYVGRRRGESVLPNTGDGGSCDGRRKQKMPSSSSRPRGICISPSSFPQQQQATTVDTRDALRYGQRWRRRTAAAGLARQTTGKLYSTGDMLAGAISGTHPACRCLISFISWTDNSRPRQTCPRGSWQKQQALGAGRSLELEPQVAHQQRRGISSPHDDQAQSHSQCCTVMRGRSAFFALAFLLPLLTTATVSDQLLDGYISWLASVVAAHFGIATMR